MLFIGDKGMLLADYGKHALLPEEKFADFKPPHPSIPKSLGHHAEWIHACKTGAPTTCNFDYAGRLTEANHLGNVAYRVGKKIEWDHQNMRITNAPDAERFLKRRRTGTGGSWRSYRCATVTFTISPLKSVAPGL